MSIRLAKTLDESLTPEFAQFICEMGYLTVDKQRIETISQLPEKLDLSRSDIENFVSDGCLIRSNVRELIVKNCKGLVDISFAADMRFLTHLNLSRCTGIVDISPLARSTSLKSLWLTGCTGIVDISPLVLCRSLNRISLIECTNVSNISVLNETTVNEIFLERCSSISGISSLNPNITIKSYL